jgi:hypothetical protein
VRGVDDQAPLDLGDPLVERADRRRLELVDERKLPRRVARAGAPSDTTPCVG